MVNSVLLGYQLYFLTMNERTGFKRSYASPQEILMYKTTQFGKDKLRTNYSLYKRIDHGVSLHQQFLAHLKHDSTYKSLNHTLPFRNIFIMPFR